MDVSVVDICQGCCAAARLSVKLSTISPTRCPFFPISPPSMPIPVSASHPNAGLQAALCSDDWFGACPGGFQADLLALARPRRLNDGESLFVRGGAADGLCCVTAGALRIGTLNDQGQLTVLAHLEPYQWFGEISIIDGLPRTHDAVADGDTQVLVVPRAGLLALVEHQPGLWRELARLACRKLRVTFSVLEELAQLPLEERVLRRLRLLAQGYGSRDVPRQRIRLGQEALAQMLGVSRQSVNKALKSLEAQGVLRLHYSEIELQGAHLGGGASTVGLATASTCGKSRL